MHNKNDNLSEVSEESAYEEEDEDFYETGPPELPS
jgi:hypothetical protein